MPELLHPEHLLRVPLTGGYIHDNMIQRTEEVARAAQGLPDPDISVVIRSRNNTDQLSWLLDDIVKQEFDGEVEVVVVDTESTDGTREVAKEFGAVVVPTQQDGFSYPRRSIKALLLPVIDGYLAL